MKTEKIFPLGLTILFMLTMASCKKQNALPPTQVATLNIVNALPTSLPLIPVQGTNGPVYTYIVPSQPQYGYYQNFKGAAAVNYGSTYLINPPAGTMQFYLVQKNADTVVANGHVAKYLFNQQLSFAPSNSYSLFVTGSDTTSADYVLTHDQLPVHRDSTCGLRFINLSSGSSPISVNIQGMTNGSEVQGLAYKSYTSFKNYKATSNISSYTFEFRDAASGTLLTTYQLSGVNDNTNISGNVNTVLFNNMTICLIGVPGQQRVIMEKNF